MKHPLAKLAASAVIFGLGALWLTAAGCGPVASGRGASDGPKVQPVTLNDPVQPVVLDGPVVLTGARNEWVGFVVQVSGLRSADKATHSLRVHSLQLQSERGVIPAAQFSAYQIISMPVATNRAGYVRHTGLSAGTDSLPRALIPLPCDGGIIDLTALRNPMSPADPQPNTGSEPVLLWIDLHVPIEAAPGEYAARIDLLRPHGDRPLAILPLKLTVRDFVLPEDRHLTVVGELDWQSLVRHFPADFGAGTPRLLNRTNPRDQGAVRTLDQLVELAQRHRVQAVVPRLQPTVKWGRSGERPQVDWSDFDSLVTPWLMGDVFEDKVPLGFWPLPAVDFLDRYDLQSRLDYWSEASRHFEQRDWLGHSALVMENGVAGRAGTAESLRVSADAAQLLKAHPRLRLLLPLEQDQIQLSSEGNPNLIPAAEVDRLIAAGKGLVFATPLQAWPTDLDPPQTWLRTDLPGLVPYAGAGGDERDVRLWAWLAFLRQAELILWSGGLPLTDNPSQRADPDEMVWFYPGHWFGISEPVPTIQLKWLRRAQQDYEYLYLARERGEVSNALVMARLITKPVEIGPTQLPDPVYSLMSGTSDPNAWEEVLRLLAQTILLRDPGQASEPADRIALNTQTIQWVVPQEKPLLIARSAQWLLEGLEDPNAVSLRLGIDVYNASDNTPDQNQLQFTQVPAGWQVDSYPVSVPALATYQVKPVELDARLSLDGIRNLDRTPVEVQFINGFTMRPYRLKLTLPAAHSDRRESSVSIDGSLDEWDATDAILDGPMVRFADRPTVQRQRMEAASVPSRLFTTWGGDGFYVAFDLAGVENTARWRTKNFVDYQFRRAWGEDLCQVLLQPVYADNSLGPVLHVVCKPGGHWVERRLDPRRHADPWQPVEGAAIRYAGVVEGSSWQGEVAIPWKIINDPDKGSPRLLRFNFVQHRNATGESASWAGPIDFGREERFMGLLHLREVRAPGMGALAE